MLATNLKTQRCALMNKSSGFTLIELMIVVAIIGILAAIALPTFQEYITRSQASEGFKMIGGLQADIGVFVAENGNFTGIDTDASIVATAAGLDGKYVSAITVAADGSINVAFDAGSLNGQTMTFNPTLTGSQISQWTCAGLLNPAHLPSGCR